MNDVERALSEIADIRAQLAASTRFRGIAPEANLLSALLLLLVAAAQSLWPEALAGDGIRFVAVWAAVLLASMAVVTLEAVARARRLHGTMADLLLASAWRQALPFLAAAILITLVICGFSPGDVWLLPGLWQILVGLLGFSVRSSLPRAIAWVAGWYFLCGAVVLVAAGWSGVLSPWMMGIPLATGQVFVALVLHRAAGEQDVEA